MVLAETCVALVAVSNGPSSAGSTVAVEGVVHEDVNAAVKVPGPPIKG